MEKIFDDEWVKNLGICCADLVPDLLFYRHFLPEKHLLDKKLDGNIPRFLLSPP